MGYKSASSEVSRDHCRDSPSYPQCDADCWLAAAADSPEVTASETVISLSEGVQSSLPYVYEKLPSSFIRLLTIEPSEEGDIVQCSIVMMEIPGALEGSEEGHKTRPFRYEARSYTWGVLDWGL